MCTHPYINLVTHGPFQMFGVEISDHTVADTPCSERVRLRNHPPGSVVAGLKLVAAGFSGVRGLREGLVEEGSSGTVGKPGEEEAPQNTHQIKIIQRKYTMFECVTQFSS